MPHDWRNEEDHGRGSSNDCEESSKSPGIGQDLWEGLEALKSAYAFRLRSCLTSSWVSSLERRPHSFYWAKRKRSSRTRRPPIVQYVYLTKIEKFYERIVASRIIRHLLVGESRTAIPEGQFGFHEGRSTVNAIQRVRSLTDQIMDGDEVTIISLDITNAFNSVP